MLPHNASTLTTKQFLFTSIMNSIKLVTSNHDNVNRVSGGKLYRWQMSQNRFCMDHIQNMFQWWYPLMSHWNTKIKWLWWRFLRYFFSMLETYLNDFRKPNFWLHKSYVFTFVWPCTSLNSMIIFQVIDCLCCFD